ncbi:hypothetical protein CK203_040082 [Vitis vinifera]|uniref:Retrovirus-related Pol polyprotein from transposon TNT 1-94 n=1 Tax=Vitis vinifera TaxID=29760 RepID=A0A438IE27_VITVI|nr:hypothetical protein CK203_040082 [Vitis vinifera]
MQPVNFSNIKCDSPELKGDNYKVWNERILLHLGCMDIDYAIRKDKSTITDTSTIVLLKAIDEQFVTSNKALASTLVMKFSSLRLTDVSGVQEHIMQMRDIAA